VAEEIGAIGGLIWYNSWLSVANGKIILIWRLLYQTGAALQP
jgi:hypothetical protein